MTAKPSPHLWPTVERAVPFAEHTVGKIFEHHWGRTIYAAENAAFSTQMLAFDPLYFNEDAAIAAGLPSTMVNPMLVFAVVFGLSVEDLSESGGAFLGASDVEFLERVFPGDTLYASSVVESARVSDSRPGSGIVSWRTTGRNQHGTEVIVYRRTNLIARGSEQPSASVPGPGDRWKEGLRFRHARSRTVSDIDLNGLTLSVMNTASGHFSERAMKGTEFGQRINFGGLTLSLVIGLATQDTTAGRTREVSLTNVRFLAPVKHGDSISAATEVIGVASTGDGEERVTFRHYGMNQDDAIVCVADRTIAHILPGGPKEKSRS